MNLPPDYPHAERKLGFEWVNPSRFTRIDSVLKSTPKVTLEDSMRLQNDITSIPARRLAALLAPLKSNDPDTRAALALFRGWDGVEHAHSAPAALYEVWTSRHLGRAFLAAVLPASSPQPSAPPTWPSCSTPSKRATLPGREALLLDIPRRRLPRNRAPARPQPRRLAVGQPAPLVPRPSPPRRRGRTPPLPTPGRPLPQVRRTLHSPNQSGYRATDFRQTGGASFRLVVDVGNWDNSRAVNYPGQSGDPASPHYRDLAPLWLRGDYFPLLYTRDAIEKATQSRILLTPQ
jgi:penicillin G amidase